MDFEIMSTFHGSHRISQLIEPNGLKHMITIKGN